ncbi:MAG: hypothetical protein ACRESO_03445, partial [Gammaproteobacteria bacterium]
TTLPDSYPGCEALPPLFSKRGANRAGGSLSEQHFSQSSLTLTYPHKKVFKFRVLGYSLV